MHFPLYLKKFLNGIKGSRKKSDFLSDFPLLVVRPLKNHFFCGFRKLMISIQLRKFTDGVQPKIDPRSPRRG